MSTPSPEDHANSIKEALYAGNKIQAIKLYRAQIKVSLAEAKSAVEKLEAELRASSPERFTKAPPQGKGCFAVILIFLSISAGVVRLFS